MSHYLHSNQIQRIIAAKLVRLGTALALCASVAAPALAQSAKQPVSQQQWIDHFENDILRFWSTPDALGIRTGQTTTRGNFPTWRCNNGTVFNDKTNACKEIVNAPTWVANHKLLDYLRMKSRQTYLYGVAFNVTGKDKYLSWMRAGIRFIVDHGLIDGGKGGAYTYWQDGKPDNLGLSRNSQDLSYVMLSLTYYYYLTGDAGILKPIDNLKAYIFKTYADPANSTNGKTCLKWTAGRPPAFSEPPYNLDESNKQELVAQLDQANAYLLLGTTNLPEPQRSQWKKDLRGLVNCMRQDYRDAKTGLFWGAIDLDRQKHVGGHKHNDFGHTVKTYWTMYLAARILDDPELQTFARDNGLKILAWAYDPKDGAWNSRPLARPGQADCEPSGPKACPIDANRDWWIYAELDQGAATMTLDKPDPARNWLGVELPRTHSYWRQNFFDQTHGDVWHRITVGKSCDPNLRNEEDSCLPKVHFYKNGFHVPEHLLVSYLTSTAHRSQPVNLYFATTNCKKPRNYTPYNLMGTATLDSCQPFGAGSLKASGLQKVKVTFNNVR